MSKFRKINLFRLKLAYHKYDSIWVLNNEIKKATEKSFKGNNVYVLSNPINIDEIKNKVKENVN